MRVGASARQHARIRKMHREGIPAYIIAKTIQMTDQSLEKILAHLDNRDEAMLAVDSDPNVQKLRLENAELATKLANYEDPELATKLAKYEDPEDEGTGTTDEDEDKDEDSSESSTEETQD